MATTKKSAAATDPFAIFSSFAPKAFEGNFEKVTETVSSITELQRGSYEAVVESASVLAKSVETAIAEQGEFAQAAFEEGFEAVKASASAGSPQEALELNSEFVRTSVEKNIGQFTKATEFWLDASKKFYAPISEKYGEAIEKAQSFRL